MRYPAVFFTFLLILAPAGAFAHSIESAGPYRIEVGWLNEPIVSGSSNSIELLISPLPEGADPEETEFQNGVTGLEKDIKIELVLGNHSAKLALNEDHNVPGRYHAFVTPTVSGYYQVNLLGKIADQPLSLSMHPPKVGDNLLIEFPPHVVEVPKMEEPEQDPSGTDSIIGYAGIGFGIVALAVSIGALRKNS